MVALGQLGAWPRWDGISKMKVSWSDICCSNFVPIQLLIQVVYDTLPSLENLHTLVKAETPQCPFCVKRRSLKHILDSCPRALGNGRYHQVLRTSAEIFNKCLPTGTNKSIRRMIFFFLERERMFDQSCQKIHYCLAQPHIGSFSLIWMSSWNSLIEHNFGLTWFMFRMWRNKLLCRS